MQYISYLLDHELFHLFGCTSLTPAGSSAVQGGTKDPKVGTKMLQTTTWHSQKEKSLMKCKYGMKTSILICPIPISTSRFSIVLRNKSPHLPWNHHHNSGLVITRRSRMELKLLQSLIPKEFTLFDLSGISLEDHAFKVVLFDLTWRSPGIERLFSVGICQKQLQAID